jgi:hypothetical protein
MTRKDFEKTLKTINNYLDIIRYKYVTEEQLFREITLSDYYDTMNTKFSTEKLSSKMSTIESLSDKLILPLKVHGVFLTEGRPRRKYYSGEELEKSTHNPINQSFPLMLDHKDDEVGSIVGKVTKIYYDPVVKGIRWEGHVNNETHARNILDGVITQVSATIFSEEEFDEELGVVGLDLTYKELSLVVRGAASGNYIAVGDDPNAV